MHSHATTSNPEMDQPKEEISLHSFCDEIKYDFREEFHSITGTEHLNLKLSAHVTNGHNVYVNVSVCSSFVCPFMCITIQNSSKPGSNDS